jgi:hypothetical protein
VTNFDSARKIADAVLYEGYLLYPYRASAVKNRFRWQFGVVAPRGYSENGGGEPWEMQTECLIEPHGSAEVDVRLRFLQVQGEGWEKGVEREVDVGGVALDEIAARERVESFGLPGGISGGISGIIRLTAEPASPFSKLRVRVENLSPWPRTAAHDRGAALRQSLVGAHTLLGVRGGAFVSLLDPPPEAKAAAAACVNLRTWPVLAGAAGARDTVLSSPIILYDYPEVAPESPGDLCDATEIDELLTLRIMTLTDEEKREACATDERARAIIERSDAIPPEVFERLHGAVRDFRPADMEAFFNPPGESAPEQAVQAGGASIRKGDRVRIQPRRRADSMDLFLAGRTARVAAIHRDVDDRTHVAVTVEDDPGADLHESYGRFFYFDPEELELIYEKEA